MSIYFNVKRSISQIGEGANAVNNDCGVASWAMVAGQYRDDIPNVDTLYKSLQSYDSYLTVGQLIELSNKWGFDSQAVIATDKTQFNAELGTGAVIALINQGEYLKLVPTFPIRSFTGAHFVAVGGYNQKGYAVYNPYQPSPYEPDIIPFDDWFKMWDKNTAQKNSNRLYITLKPKTVTTNAPKAKVVANALNVRNSPNGKVIGSLSYGTVVNVHDMKKVGGNTWAKVKPTEEQWVCAMEGSTIYLLAI